MNIKLNENEYIIEKDEDNVFDIDEIKDKFTDYFDKYDYILGDYSYDLVRLKGFCLLTSKYFKQYNDYRKIDKYIEERCAPGCKYFILKKIDKKK